MRSAIDFSQHVRERSRNFVGREWVFRELDEWLKSDHDRYFLITASPGFGKTAISAQLVNFSWGLAPVPSGLTHFSPNFLQAIHFCSRADASWCDPRIFASSISRQLASRFPVFEKALAAAELYFASTTIHVEAHGGTATGVEHFHAASLSGEEAFNRLVRQPLNQLTAAMPGERILILVDGLDEALVTGGNEIVALLSRMFQLSLNVRFVLTSRSSQEIESAFGGARLILSARAYDDLNRKDLLDYVRKRSSNLQASAEEQVHLSRAFAVPGNFLYASFGLDLVATLGVQEPLLDLVAENLDGLFYNWINRLIEWRGKSWAQDYAPIIGPLMVAGAKLSILQLSRFSGLPNERLRGNLADLREFLTDAQGYLLYHQCFAEFFGHQNLKQKKSELLNPYYLDAQQQHLKIVGAYKGDNQRWDQVDWRKCDDYGLEYLLTHLAALRGGEIGSGAIFDYLCPGVMREKRSRFGTDSSFLHDIFWALDIAKSEGNISEAIRCLSLTASLAESAAGIATQVLAAYAWSGRPEVTTSWAAMRRVAYDHIALAEFFLLHDRPAAAREALERAYEIARTQHRFRSLRLTMALMHRAGAVERPAQIVQEILRANQTPGHGSAVFPYSNKHWMQAFVCLSKGCAVIGEMGPMYAAMGLIPNCGLKLFCLTSIADAWMAVGNVEQAKKVLHKALVIKVEDRAEEDYLFNLAHWLILAGEQEQATKLTKRVGQPHRLLFEQFLRSDGAAVESLFDSAFQAKDPALLHISVLAATRQRRIDSVIEKAKEWRDEIEPELRAKSPDDEAARDAVDRELMFAAVSAASQGDWARTAKSLSLLRWPAFLQAAVPEVGEKLARSDAATFERGEDIFCSLAGDMDAPLLRNLINAMRAYAHARHGNREQALRLADQCIHEQRRYPRIEPVVKTFVRIAEWLASNGKPSARRLVESTRQLVSLGSLAGERDEALKPVAEAVAKVETILHRSSGTKPPPFEKTLISSYSSEIRRGFSKNPKTLLAAELVQAAVHIVETQGPAVLSNAIFELADEDLIEAVFELTTIELLNSGEVGAAVLTSLSNLRVQAACRGKSRFFAMLSEDVPVYWSVGDEELLLRIADRLANAERFWS